MSDPQQPLENKLSLKDFFERIPPGQEVSFNQIATQRYTRNGLEYVYDLPLLDLHCDTDGCNGVRAFEVAALLIGNPGHKRDCFVTFQCRNCKENVRVYALQAYLAVDGHSGLLFKMGERPSFGPPIPAKVITLIGPDRDYYLKGRRAENQGLGIGAFAYYRRVVENQKNRILDEIIRVATKLNASTEMLNDLDAAKNEIQFSKTVSSVKHGIPEALLINGHNPLTLLHSALSQGLHAQEDAECLELATSIRIVLTDLADRLGNALKDQAELNAAVSKLINLKIT